MKKMTQINIKNASLVLAIMVVSFGFALPSAQAAIPPVSCPAGTTPEFINVLLTSAINGRYVGDNKGEVFDHASASFSLLPGDRVFVTGDVASGNSAHATDDAVDFSGPRGGYTRDYSNNCNGLIVGSEVMDLTHLFLSGSETTGINTSISATFRDICGVGLSHGKYYVNIGRCVATAPVAPLVCNPGSMLGNYNQQGTIPGNPFVWYHNFDVTAYNPSTGAFSGNGHYLPDSTVTWVFTGTLTGSTVNMHITYTAHLSPYTADLTGTLSSNGNITWNAWSDSDGNHGIGFATKNYPPGCVTTTPTCSTNTQCGTNGLTGGNFCQNNGVYQNYTTYTCNNAGTGSSYCSTSTVAQLQNTCSGNQTCSGGSCTAVAPQCSDGTDNDGDNLIDSADPGCHTDFNRFNSASYNPNGTNEGANNRGIACQDGVDNNGNNLVDANDPGCHTDGNASNPNSYNPSDPSEDGTTNNIACSTNTQCGTNGLTGGNFCQNNGVYQNYTTYTCNNAGTGSSYCSTSTVAQLQNTCSGNQTCSGGSCTNVTNNCTYHSFQQCVNNAVYWFNSCGVQQDVAQVCSGNQTCSNNTCVSQQMLTLSSSETVRNVTAGIQTWATFITANPSDILEFKVVIQSNISKTVNNVTVREIFPPNLYNYAHLTLDGLPISGDITYGVNIGSVFPYQTRTLTYQAKVGPYEAFSYGTTTLRDPVDVTSTDPNYQKTDTNETLIAVTKTQVQGATDISTGLTNNLLTDSFFLPLAGLMIGLWFFRARVFTLISGSASGENALQKKIQEIRNRENA